MGRPSKAISGRGTILSIGGVTGGTGTETFTPIGEVMDASISGTAVATDDVTNFDSGFDDEFIATTRNNGELSVSGNTISGDAGQVALRAAYDSGNRYDFKLTLPKTASQTSTGDSYAFSALVTSLDLTVQTKGGVKFSSKLKISGAVTPTTGS